MKEGTKKDEGKKDDNKKDENINPDKNDLEECQKKAEEYLNGWKRERADFLNYKKEEMERIGQLVKYANEEIILKLLPILDNFYLAEKHPSTGSGQALHEGFLQIKKQVEDFLKKEGIEPIEVLGKEFDPNLMESVGQTPNTQNLPPNTVSDTIQRG